MRFLTLPFFALLALCLSACGTNAALIPLTVPLELNDALTGRDFYDNDITVYYPQGWSAQGKDSGMLLSNLGTMEETVTLTDGQIILYFDFWSHNDVPYLICTDDRSLETAAEHVILSAILVPPTENPIPSPFGDPEQLFLGDQIAASITEVTDLGNSIALAVEKDGGYAIVWSIARDVPIETQRHILYSIAQGVQYNE